MRRLLLLLCITIFSTSFAAASDSLIIEPPVRPADPILEATGGGSVAMPRGTRAIRLNPADFTGSFRLTVAGGAGGLAIEPALLERGISRVVDGGMLPLPRNFAEVYADEFGARGFGFSAGGDMAFAGSGLGVGIASDFDIFMRTGPNSDDADGYLISETALVGGIAIPFSIGDFDFSAGGSIRPTMRIRGELTDRQAVDAFAAGKPFDEAFADTPVLNGFGLAIDAGVLARSGNFSFGATVRDIGDTEFVYHEHSLAEVLDSIPDGTLPSGGESGGELFDPSATYATRMSTRFGVAWSRSEGFFRPAVSADIYDPHLFLSRDRSIYEHFSAGAELDIGRVLIARAGISADGYGLGTGVRLGPIRVDSSVRFGTDTPPRASLGARLEF